MAELQANAQQLVNPGEVVIFTDNPVRDYSNLIRWREGSGNILLAGYVPYTSACRCCSSRSASYLVDFGANIAIPTGGTVGEISVAIALDGTSIPASTMIVTPAAVEQFFNISRAINADVWRGCCETLSVRNTSDQPILVQNANIIVSRPDLLVVR